MGIHTPAVAIVAACRYTEAMSTDEPTVNHVPRMSGSPANRIRSATLQTASAVVSDHLDWLAEQFDATTGSTAERLAATFTAFNAQFTELHQRPLLDNRRTFSEWPVEMLREACQEFEIDVQGADVATLVERLDALNEDQLRIARLMRENGMKEVWVAYLPLHDGLRTRFHRHEVTMPDWFLDE